jgi:hypothetical protein
VENNLFRYVQFPPGVHACDHCKAGYVITGMSFFDEEWCCLPCLENEKLLPGYTAAREAERREVTAGNQRYPGIGLATCHQLALDEAGETPFPDAA